MTPTPGTEGRRVKIILAALFAIALAGAAWGSDVLVASAAPKPGDVCVVQGDGTMTCSSKPACTITVGRGSDAAVIQSEAIPGPHFDGVNGDCCAPDTPFSVFAEGECPNVKVRLTPSRLAGRSAQAIVGQARVIDGDTIEVAGQRIRLFGIDAPERAQTCESDAGVYECGRDATATLAALLRDRSVSCEPKDRDRYGRTVAVCSTEAGDIGAAMVEAGWAIVYRRYAKGAYEAEEAAAKAEKLGLWSGRFEMPADWRRRHAR